MATAVEPNAIAQPANPRVRLALASLFGALFVIAGVAAAAYAVPMAWDKVVAPALAMLGGPAATALRLLAQAATVAGFVYVGSSVAGANPPKGVRGGIFLAISALITTFFVTRAFGMSLEGSPVGLPVTLVVLGGLLYGTYYLLTSPRGQDLMVALEEQGWFHTFSYKRTQGVRTRRYTLIGFLLLGWSGVYSMYVHGTAGSGVLELPIPFTGSIGKPPFVLTPLADVEFTIPLLLGLAAFWVSWRAVNMPMFADFLIATEAEMNKVSWPTRKGLIQDTIVVLVTTIVMTLFLLVVDWFWGTLLSGVGVLPQATNKAADPANHTGPGW